MESWNHNQLHQQRWVIFISVYHLFRFSWTHVYPAPAWCQVFYQPLPSVWGLSLQVMKAIPHCAWEKPQRVYRSTKCLGLFVKDKRDVIPRFITQHTTLELCQALSRNVPDTLNSDWHSLGSLQRSRSCRMFFFIFAFITHWFSLDFSPCRYLHSVSSVLRADGGF